MPLSQGKIYIASISKFIGYSGSVVLIVVFWIEVYSITIHTTILATGVGEHVTLYLASNNGSDLCTV